MELAELGCRVNNSPQVMRLAYALRGFLETCERDLMPQRPLRTVGVPEYIAAASIEYRAEIARRKRVWR